MRKRKQRKPLVERVEWEEAIPNWWTLEIAGIGVEVMHRAATYRDYRCRCWLLGDSRWHELEADSEFVAKAQALRIVQAAVSKAFEQWRD